MAATRPPSKPHALVLPLPIQGHINPLLRFSIHLALRGFIITFVNTETSHKRLLKAQFSQSPILSDPADPDRTPVDIRFVTIPVVPIDSEAQFTMRAGEQVQNRIVTDLQNGIEHQRGLIEQMIESSKADLHPISCIIADSPFSWTQDLANKAGIGRIVFQTWSGTALGCLLRYRKFGKWSLHDRDIHDDEIEEVDTSGLRVGDSEFQAAIALVGVQRLERHAQQLGGSEAAVCIAVNSFEDLESYNLQSSSEYSIPIRYIGPLMPFERSDVGKSNPIISGDLFEEENDCLDWLNNQNPASVLYVSFGSIAALSTAQIEELALGIEESEQPFLWVARANVEGGTVFPKGFIERTRGRGLVIGWAPQVKVLEHPATAAFVTHCGWNSTLESLHMGVPMLCLPITADQPLNAVLIEKQWRAGVAMVKGEDGLVRKEDVLRAVKAVMQSREIRDEATRWKMVSRQALSEGGSSHKNLTSLIADIEQFNPPPASQNIPTSPKA